MTSRAYPSEAEIELAFFAHLLKGKPHWIARQVWFGPRMRADIVLRDTIEGGPQDGAAIWLIVEVKAATAGWSAYEQLLGYAAAWHEITGDLILPILAAPAFGSDLRREVLTQVPRDVALWDVNPMLAGLA
jgi:hypothetical protein